MDLSAQESSRSTECFVAIFFHRERVRSGELCMYVTMLGTSEHTHRSGYASMLVVFSHAYIFRSIYTSASASIGGTELNVAGWFCQFGFEISTTDIIYKAATKDPTGGGLPPHLAIPPMINSHLLRLCAFYRSARAQSTAHTRATAPHRNDAWSVHARKSLYLIAIGAPAVRNVL